MPRDRSQERKLLEEETKLTAAWLNGLSLAFLIAGLVQPLVTGVFTATSMILIGGGLVLHLFARFWLRRWYPLEHFDGPA